MLQKLNGQIMNVHLRRKVTFFSYFYMVTRTAGDGLINAFTLIAIFLTQG